MGFLDWFKSPDHNQLLREGLERLLADSPRVKALWNKLQDQDYPITIEDDDLAGDTEGSTTVSYDSAAIRIDVGKVLRLRDCLEAVIAHELFHVHDARFKWTPETFIASAESDDDLPWDQRPVEKSAIEQEDELRKELMVLPRYKNIAPTRKQQNIIAKRRR